MSHIKDVFAKIDDLKISIFEAFIIYALNNFDSYFWSYLAFLNYDIQKKKKLLTLSKLTKALGHE